jgi:hypothetical protein
MSKISSNFASSCAAPWIHRNHYHYLFLRCVRRFIAEISLQWSLNRAISFRFRFLLSAISALSFQESIIPCISLYMQQLSKKKKSKNSNIQKKIIIYLYTFKLTCGRLNRKTSFMPFFADTLYLERTSESSADSLLLSLAGSCCWLK